MTTASFQRAFSKASGLVARISSSSSTSSFYSSVAARANPSARRELLLKARDFLLYSGNVTGMVDIDQPIQKPTLSESKRGPSRA